MNTNEILFVSRLSAAGLFVTIQPGKDKPLLVWTSLGETSCKLLVPRAEIAEMTFPERMADRLVSKVSHLFKAEGLQWPPV
jgi:hypothetical protein